MASIFTKIVRGELPSYKVAETTDYLAFLDLSPLVEGHTLVIPKKEINSVYDMDDELCAGLFLLAKKVGKAIGKVVPCKKVGLTIIGIEVPHVHIHLVPINKVSDISFTNPKLHPSLESFSAMAEKLKAAYNAL